MMMSKPAPESTNTEESPPAFAMTAKKTPQSAVEDLERRLAMLGNAAAAPAVVPEQHQQIQDMKPPAVAAPAVEAAAPVKGGKNALLARIMAAQERTKQAQNKPTPPPPSNDADLLMTLDAPTNDPPPPAFDSSFFPAAPAELPPPAFDSVQDSIMPQMDMSFPPPPPMDAVAPPPPAFMSSSAPMYEPSAPSFEDLLDGQQHHHHHQPNSLETMQAVPPPSHSAPPDMSIDEDVLAALDPAEREALLAEQRQIMEQIESAKASDQASGAAARAMSFNQRSNTAVAQAIGNLDRPSSSRAAAAPSSASKNKKSSSSSSNGTPRTVNLGAGEDVPLHDQAKTKQAIKDGTAILCQCINCQNWMQVTDNATLMFCPVCQVVSPVERDGNQSIDMEAAAQMTADQKMAEEMQQEEYKKAEGTTARAAPKTPKKQVVEEGMSWYDWMVGNPKVAPTPTHGSSELPSRVAKAAAASKPAGLVAAQTGEESGAINFASSYDEQTRPLSGGGARMAESKGMFACVADSITTAAQAVTTLSEDPEGNVHGVDSSSLLAMPQVSRQKD